MPAARELYDRANEILGYDLAEICFHGPPDLINATQHSQPGLFVTSMASLEKLKAESPDVVQSCTVAAGLSLGEYSALCFAGVIAFEDALRTVRLRGQAMQQAADANPGGMVAILGLERSQVEQLCDEARAEGQILQVANLLCPANIVCSGHKDACRKLAELATSAGAMKAVSLTVAGAFHTEMMHSAVDQLADALGNIQMQPPNIPVVSNVDAKTHDDPDEIRQLLAQQVVSPVYWEDSIRTMLGSGVDAFYEIGAGKVLRGLMKRIERKVPVTNI